MFQLISLFLFSFLFFNRLALAVPPPTEDFGPNLERARCALALAFSVRQIELKVPKASSILFYSGDGMQGLRRDDAQFKTYVRVCEAHFVHHPEVDIIAIISDTGVSHHLLRLLFVPPHGVILGGVRFSRDGSHGLFNSTQFHTLPGDKILEKFFKVLTH